MEMIQFDYFFQMGWNHQLDKDTIWAMKTSGWFRVYIYNEGDYIKHSSIGIII